MTKTRGEEMNALTEHPILMSGAEVRNILEGRQTQIRRVIKNWPPKIFLPNPIMGDWPIGHKTIASPGIYQPVSNPNGALSVNVDSKLLGIKPGEFEWVCPYGKPGDRLWVKETFVLECWGDEPKPPKDGRPLHHHIPDQFNEFDSEYWLWPHYKATDPAPELAYEDDENWDGEPACRAWHSSTHMPRWASRITLEVVNFRVERVQDISTDDAYREGIKPNLSTSGTNCLEKFRALWNSINAKRGYGWDVNPWVFVIEFKELKLTYDEIQNSMTEND